jgi:carbon storage regulator
MLVLSRHTHETISFPELGITVKVVKIKGKTVSLGIEAPDQIQILRGELVESATSFDAPKPAPKPGVAQELQCSACSSNAMV